MSLALYIYIYIFVIDASPFLFFFLAPGTYCNASRLVLRFYRLIASPFFGRGGIVYLRKNIVFSYINLFFFCINYLKARKCSRILRLLLYKTRNPFSKKENHYHTFPFPNFFYFIPSFFPLDNVLSLYLSLSGRKRELSVGSKTIVKKERFSFI